MDLFPGFSYDDFVLFANIYGRENAIKMLKNYAKEFFKSRL